MDLEEIDQGVFEIWKTVQKLEYVNPINQQEEKEKFMKSSYYNPKFNFIPLDFNPDKFIKQLQSYKKELDSSIIAGLISKKIDKQIIWINLLKSRGTEKFTEYSVEYYGRPDLNLISNALRILKKNSKREEEPPTITAEEMAEHLNNEVNRMKLDWSVKVKENLGAKADDVAAEETLYIKKGEMFTKKDLKRLTVHELGVHSTRAFNAKKLKYKIFFIGTAEYEVTEEGLAAVMEEKEGILEISVLKSYAGRVLAVNMALQKSFRGVYIFLCRYFPKDEAYQLTMRAKRGITDTSKPGSFTKDHIYLKGMELVRQIPDLRPLFKGRVGVEDLFNLRELRI